MPRSLGAEALSDARTVRTRRVKEVVYIKQLIESKVLQNTTSENSSMNSSHHCFASLVVIRSSVDLLVASTLIFMGLLSMSPFASAYRDWWSRIGPGLPIPLGTPGWLNKGAVAAPQRACGSCCGTVAAVYGCLPSPSFRIHMQVRIKTPFIPQKLQCCINLDVPKHGVRISH